MSINKRLVSDYDDVSIGFLEPGDEAEDEIVYQPAIMFNMRLKSYIPDPPEVNKYRAYGCDVKLPKTGKRLI